MTAVEALRALPRPLLLELRAELGPLFANEAQRTFFESEAGELLYSGAFGAGKSRIVCEKAYALGLRYPGAPIGVFRKVAASLAATTKMTFLRDVVPPGGIVKSNKTEGWYELANGSRFWFLGLDPDPQTGIPSKVGSLDLAYAFVDEAVELTESDWMMLLGRLRWPDVPYHQIGAATNPADPAHWIKRRFSDDAVDRQMLQAKTTDNRLLPQDYRDRMDNLTGLYHARYVRGEWISVEGPLWKMDQIVIGPSPKTLERGEIVDSYARVVIGVDPAVTSMDGADETGIVVCGKGTDGRGYVIDDRSCRLPPSGWAQRVVDAYDEYRADRIVVEVNNGGEMVETVLRAIGKNLAITSVHASRGKVKRAEPVAALYEKGRITHLGQFSDLESQMMAFDPARSKSHDDRVDALVWGFTDLFGLSDKSDAWGGGKAWGSAA